MMGNVYRELRGNLPFPLLKVWKDSQSVIREFKAQKNCVLFAAGSCWEGVDFPGDRIKGDRWGKWDDLITEMDGHSTSGIL